ncbi:MAG: aldolase [Pirellulales bacterium]|nr:aldolase [Pirellulales bacterium]
MRTSRILEKFGRNEPVLITQLHLTDPSVFELTTLMGFDGIWMDMEHHFYSLETAGNLMRAARLGVTDIVARPGKGEFMRMQRMLEAGAQGIMYPRCDDAAEAREVVRWAKFQPMGVRGFDGGNPDMPYCSMPTLQYLEEANKNTFIIIQVEQPNTLENIDEIAAVDGVDALMLGPCDFSIQSGFPGDLGNEKMTSTARRINEAARKAGKKWGMPVGSVEAAKQKLDMGADMIFYHADIVAIKLAQEQIQKDFAPLGFTFENQLLPKDTSGPKMSYSK